MEEKLNEAFQYIDMLLQKVTTLEAIVDELAKDKGLEIEWDRLFLVKDIY